MSARTRTCRRALAAPLLALALPAAAHAQCPPAGEVEKTIQTLFRRPEITVKNVGATPVKGLCEIQVSFQGRPNVLYVDASGGYFLTGHMIEAESGKDLTEDTLSALNTIPAQEMKKLEGLTALTLGTKGQVVYFVTDPQ